MIVVIVIVGILSAMAHSGWNRVMWMVQAKGAADEFRNALLLARGDAMARRHNSGLYLDPANHRYLRFVDSTLGDFHDGAYEPGAEKVVQAWDTLPPHMVFYSITSTSSPDPEPKDCGAAGAPHDSTTSGLNQLYSIVFKPDGRAWAGLTAKLGTTTFPNDTFFVDVLPATGLVTSRR